MMDHASGERFRTNGPLVYHYNCINSANTKEIMLRYYTASSGFHPGKSFHSYACSGRTSVTHY